MILEQIGRLRSSGYSIFILAHTKFKDKTDPMTGEKYEQLTNNLRSDYYNAVAHIAQMITTITIEREIKEGKQVGEKRVMYFRPNGIVDAGGRFTNLPEKLELSAENFMSAFEIGVKSSFLDGVSDTDLEKKKEQEIQQLERQAEVAKKKEKEKETSENNADLVAVIQQKYPKATDDVKDVVKDIMNRYNIANFKSPDELSTEGLQKIVEVLG
jgi:hypothetical protein